jgi:hypothetical protein
VNQNVDEANLVALWRAISSGACRPARSIAFIVERPVKRQIFAADFRDRVVRGDTSACRMGEGTHMGIRRVERFLRRCSQNYARDRFVLKLDAKASS